PVVAGIEGGSQIFNIVFFVTLLSLLVQGTTVIKSARILKLVDNSISDEDEFDVELGDQLPTSLQTMKLSDKHLANGDTLRDIRLPEGSLVMLVKRGQNYMVPNGRLHLHPHDTLLIISENQADTSKPRKNIKH
ncbi:MAG: potassium/proton antiporter, partial [Muribaculaceae bacterium]|nr:potassium/proton antiporter [Muribaculaceae bacterium]